MMNNTNNNNKSFADILHETYVNECKKIEEEAIQAANTWLEVCVKPALLESAKNLKTSRAFVIPNTISVNRVKDICNSKPYKLSFEIKNNDSIVFYW